MNFSASYRRNGSILIMCLWIMAILSLCAMGIGFRASLALRLSKYSLERARAKYLAKAGIAKARVLLADDMNDSDAKDYDTLYKCGVAFSSDETPVTLFSAEKNMLGDGSFSVHYMRKREIGLGEEPAYGMMDEDRKIDIRISKYAPNNLGEYRRIMKNLSPSMTVDRINSIMYWQGVTPDGMSVSADDAYYIKAGYLCKGKDLEYPEELKLVMGIDQALYDEIKPFVTTFTDGKVNVNTAPKEVLNALMDAPPDNYRGSVENIWHARKGSDDSEGTGDDLIFRDVGSVVERAQEDQKTRVSEIATKYFTFSSKIFRIRSRGVSGQVARTITCIVARPQGGKEKVFSYYEE